MANEFLSVTDAVVQMDNASDSLTDISSQVAQVNLKVTRKIGKFSTFGLGATNKTAGKPDYTGAVGVYPTDNTGTSEAHRLMTAWNVADSQATRSFRVQHPDASAGSYQYDFEAFCTDYEILKQDANGDGTPPLQMANIEVDGSVTTSYIS